MNEVDALELVQNALWTTMWICVPLVLPAMAVGIIVALFQALTQIQESTLTFVPKMIVVFISAMASAAFVGSQMQTLAENAYDRIATGF
ncbi:MAG: flagellar biosynthetic protein FliQ [Aestuariivirga sp.]|jgi:flagellar biosynthetic protein FliQ